ncbi:MAG: cytochrome c family protein [Planctomycetota bacterium]
MASQRKAWWWAGCAMVALAIGYLGWTSSSASANPPATTAAVAASVGVAVTGEGNFTYVGSDKCKKCHLASHKEWEKTKHGTALEALKPGQATERKTKAKLDPQKDYSTDATCVACHVVGMGKPGGYELPKDEEGAKKMKGLTGVGCENCHGPGSKYVELHEEIMKSKRKYKVDEMYAAGMTKADVNTCKGCHNEKSPTVDPAIAFDFEKMKKDGVHATVELKQREN